MSGMPSVSRQRRRYLNGFPGGCRGDVFVPHASAALNRNTKTLRDSTDPTNQNQLPSLHTSGADSADTQTDPPIHRSPSPTPASADSHQTPRKKSAPTAQNPTSPSSPPPPPPSPSPAASYAHPHYPPSPQTCYKSDAGAGAGIYRRR